MREWAGTIRAVDEQVDRALAEGIFALRHEERFLVVDAFDEPGEFVEIAGEWGGTRIPPALAAKVLKSAPPITIEQEVRLRLLGT